MPHIAGSGAKMSGDGRVQPAQIRQGVWQGHAPTTIPPGPALGVCGPLQPCRANVARGDHHGVCCRGGIASGIGLLLEQDMGVPKAYRMSAAMPPSPNCKLRPSERQNPISLTVSSHNWFSHMSLISSLVKSTSFLFLIHRRRLLITRGHVFKMNSFPAMTFRGTK